MIEITQTPTLLTLKHSDTVITLEKHKKEVAIHDFSLDFPGEYEKSGVLATVDEFEEKLCYHLLVDGKHVALVLWDNFSLTETFLEFLGDIDILVIVGTKQSAKMIENIEAKMIVPFGEETEIFLGILGQHQEAVPSVKIKWELSGDTTEFVHLA